MKERIPYPETDLALSCKDVALNISNLKRISKIEGDGSNHLVEHHDGRFRGDQLSQPEIDPLLLGGVRKLFERRS